MCSKEYIELTFDCQYLYKKYVFTCFCTFIDKTLKQISSLFYVFIYIE